MKTIVPALMIGILFVGGAVYLARSTAKDSVRILKGCTLERKVNDSYFIQANDPGRAESEGPVQKVAWDDYYIYGREQNGWIIIDPEKGIFIGHWLSDSEFRHRYPDVKPLSSEEAYAKLNE